MKNQKYQIPGLTVIYEDNHLIAINKPAGALVHGDETGDETLSDKVKQYINEWFQTKAQIITQENIVSNTTALQRAEETLFFNGESSLFLINSRELRKVEAEIKRIDLQKKNQTMLINLKAAAGLYGK